MFCTVEGTVLEMTSEVKQRGAQQQEPHGEIVLHLGGKEQLTVRTPVGLCDKMGLKQYQPCKIRIDYSAYVKDGALRKFADYCPA